MLPTSITQFKKFGGFLMVKQIFLSIGMFLFLTFSVGCGNSSPESSVEVFMDVMSEVVDDGEFTSSQRDRLGKVIPNSDKSLIFNRFETTAQEYKKLYKELPVNVKLEYEILSDETKISENGKNAYVKVKSKITMPNGSEEEDSTDFLLKKNDSGDWLIFTR